MDCGEEGLRFPSQGRQRLDLYCYGELWAAALTLTAEFFIPQLHNAANANQKEKYEADLKKEIKKLQVRGLGLDSVVLWEEGWGEWTAGSQGDEVTEGPSS